MTERDVPSLHLIVQLAPRGDIRWRITEGASPFVPREPYEAGGFTAPDATWQELRRELPVAIATWLHRLRRADDADSGLPLPRD